MRLSRLGLCCLIVGCAVGGMLRAGATNLDAPRAVAALLGRSASAWNRGDLDAFMTAYERSPATIYVGSASVIRGYAAIRAHYASRYHPGAMGTLRVSDLHVRRLGADYAVADARWHLARDAARGGDASGLFTLVLHRAAGGWHIVTDHTP